jgi:hypothetical protein
VRNGDFWKSELFAKDALTEVAEANECLSNLVPTSLTESRWSRAVALHVPKMRRWWRCVASSLTDSALMKARRRQDLSFMLGAVVGSQLEQEQAAIVGTMREWSNDFLDKEGRPAEGHDVGLSAWYVVWGSS